MIAAWTLAGLGATGVALLIVTVASARQPHGPLPDTHGLLVRWRATHGDIDPTGNAWLEGWLQFVHAVARPLARRGVQPVVLTLWSLWLAAAVVVLAWVAPGWRIVAGWLLVVSALADALDGAVAVATQRTTRWGAVLDSAVDRVTDVLYLVAVVVVGGPLWLAAATGVAVFMLEYVRARAESSGGSPVGAVTVAERPTRVICCSLGVAAAGVLPGLAALIATTALGVLAVLSMSGLVHLVVVVHRELTAQPQHSSSATMRADNSTSGSPPPG